VKTKSNDDEYTPGVIFFALINFLTFLMTTFNFTIVSFAIVCDIHKA
jgi:hypothetical protein